MFVAEHMLYDIFLMEKAAIPVFEELKSKYGFSDYTHRLSNRYDAIITGVIKNEVIISAFITKREAYTIEVRRVDDPDWQLTRWSRLYFEKFPRETKTADDYWDKLLEDSLAFEKHSYEWFHHHISGDIRFLEMYYSEIFTLGKYPAGFEK